MAGGAKNSNSTVADQRRSVYKMAGKPNAYQEHVNALNEKPELRSSQRGAVGAEMRAPPPRDLRHKRELCCPVKH